MSKLVKIEIFAMFFLLALAAASEFYANFPGCVAPNSFYILAAFLLGAVALVFMGLFITLCEGK